MSTTSKLVLEPGEYPRPSQPSPRPLASITASAARIRAAQVSRGGGSSSTADWQAEAWDMYDLVGEQHFLADTLSGRLAQAKFYVGKLPRNSTEDIEAVESGPAWDVFQSLVGNGPEFSQKIRKIGLNLFMAGECFILGAPADSPKQTSDPLAAILPNLDEESGLVDLSDLTWSVYSTEEVSLDREGTLSVRGPGRGEDSVQKFNLDDVFFLRIWKEHPRHRWEADSSTRACLPILRELVGLTMHISAQTDSRLAGAGVFLIPASADAAIRAQAGIDESDPSPFVEALMDAMLTPISNRSSASAIVPIMPTVPDESVDKFRFISFASQLDGEARSLRDEAIRRLALSQDCPPEILLGVGGMNHWGAWLVREDVVVTHLEPPLALICDAITSQFLWPVLEQLGVKDYGEFVIWYDVSDMVLRPDRSASAKELHASNVISDKALRVATGFDESDAPSSVGEQDPALAVVLDLVKAAPSLAQDPGMPALLEQVTALLSGKDLTEVKLPASESEPSESGGEAGPPATDPAEAPDGLAAAANTVQVLSGLRSSRPEWLDTLAESEKS